ncbi:hypothetical protein [Thiorhodococcus mannitoliphagus]|nr:hypothetical protein [Thiorhodococcus mannitoliphagus]
MRHRNGAASMGLGSQIGRTASKSCAPEEEAHEGGERAGQDLRAE